MHVKGKVKCKVKHYSGVQSTKKAKVNSLSPTGHIYVSVTWVLIGSSSVPETTWHHVNTSINWTITIQKAQENAFGNNVCKFFGILFSCNMLWSLELTLILIHGLCYVMTSVLPASHILPVRQESLFNEYGV